MEKILSLSLLLTQVLVGALFIRITISMLEQTFHLYALEKLFSYFRVVLGIGLVFLLLFG